MPGQMSSAERERKMKEFEWANKNPVAAARMEREREANQKEMAGLGIRNPLDAEQLPSTQRRKSDMK